MVLDVPDGGIDRLPDALQVRLSVGRARRLVRRRRLRLSPASARDAIVTTRSTTAAIRGQHAAIPERELTCDF